MHTPTIIEFLVYIFIAVLQKVNNTNSFLVRKSWIINTKEISYTMVSESVSLNQLKTLPPDHESTNSNHVLLSVTGKVNNY